MDMDVDCSRKDKKTCAVDYPVCCCPGTDMSDPAILYRDIRRSPVKGLDICKHEGWAAFHADMIGAGPYSHTVLRGCLKTGAGEYNTFSVTFPNEYYVEPEKPGAVFSSGLPAADPGLMGEIMDKIIKVTLGLFVIILVLFVSVVSYTAYVNTSYRDSLTGTYEYNCTITTNTVLSNVTFFLPVPADMTGNSPVISQISRQQVTGVPEDWTITLYDTGKATLLKISAPRIGQNAVNGSTLATSITFEVNASSHTLIDTRSPVENAAVFRPVQDIQTVACPAGDATAVGTPVCSEYLTSIYADYTAAPSASVSISASLDATNSWSIFTPESNGYKNRIDVLMHGDNHGWETARGWLESGIGVYDTPVITS